MTRSCNDYCASDFDRLIKIKRRSITAPVARGDSNYGETFADLDSVLAKIETKAKGTVFFDETTNEEIGTADTIITIYFVLGVSAQTWIEFENINYRILNVIDIDKRHEYLILSCTERGDSNLAVNFA